MKQYPRIVLLTCALSAASPAEALSITDVGNFFTQLNQWLDSIKKIETMAGDIFNQIDYKDLGDRLSGIMSKSGLKLAGLDLTSIIGPLINNAQGFQKKINDIRADIDKQTQKFAQLAFGDDFDKGTPLEGTVGLSPELSTMRMSAGLSMATANDMSSRNVKDVGTASQVVDNSQENVKDAQKHAEDENTNASDIISKADTIQSTREGIQLLVHAQAETIMNSAYQTTALTNQITQSVRQTQVSNNMLSDMVQDIVDKRKDVANATIDTIRLQQAQASNIAENAQDSVNTAADGIEQTFKGDANAIDPTAFY